MVIVSRYPVLTASKRLYLPLTRLIRTPVAVSRSVELTGGYFFRIVFNIERTSPSLSWAETLNASPTSEME